MPARNPGPELIRAVASIRGQKGVSWELIVVDDGSSPALSTWWTPDDERFSVLRNEARLGIGAALNKGIAFARGRYVARMDVDDVSRPDRLVKQLRFLERRPEIGFCGGWVRVTGADAGAGEVWRYPLEPDDVRATLLFESTFAHPTVMFRRSVFAARDDWYAEELENAQDYEFWIRLTEDVAGANVPQVLLDYTVGSGDGAEQKRLRKRAVADGLRARLLRRLGVEPSEDERRIHGGLSYWSLAEIGAPANAVRAWLGRIVEANDAARRFDQAAVRRAVCRRWRWYCKVAARAGMAGHGLRLQAPPGAGFCYGRAFLAEKLRSRLGG